MEYAIALAETDLARLDDQQEPDEGYTDAELELLAAVDGE